MAATTNPLVVKRLKYELEDGFKVYLNCAVQMFDFDSAGEMKFRGFFPKGSSLHLNLSKSKAAMARGFKFYYVSAGMKEGYVPKSAFHDFVYAQLSDTPYTGVTYGGDKWLSNGQNNLLAFPADEHGKYPCPECGCPINDHKLQETTRLSALLVELIDYLKESAKGRAFGHNGFMLAGLRTKGDRYIVAYSGTLGTADLKEFQYCVSCLPEKAVLAQGLPTSEYFYDLKLTRKYRNTAASWSCAAPRAIQCAWADVQDYPIEMSEKWFGDQLGKVAIQKHTIKSCDECRKYLPHMMCGTAFMRL